MKLAICGSVRDDGMTASSTSYLLSSIGLSGETSLTLYCCLSSVTICQSCEPITSASVRSTPTVDRFSLATVRIER